MWLPAGRPDRCDDVDQTVLGPAEEVRGRCDVEHPPTRRYAELPGLTGHSHPTSRTVAPLLRRHTIGEDRSGAFALISEHLFTAAGHTVEQTQLAEVANERDDIRLYLRPVALKSAVGLVSEACDARAPVELRPDQGRRRIQSMTHTGRFVVQNCDVVHHFAYDSPARARNEVRTDVAISGIALLTHSNIASTSSHACVSSPTTNSHH